VLTRTLTWLARLYPWAVAPSRELERSLTFLHSRVGGETVVRAGYGGAVLVVLLSPLVVVVAPSSTWWMTVAGVLLSALLTAHAIHRGPVLIASVRRTRATGDAPGLVGRAVLRMRIEPTAESAAAFAGRTGTGRLAESLREHVHRANGTPRTGLGGFATEWESWAPSIRRAVSLVEAAADAPTGERERTLERALQSVLDGTRNRMAAFADDVRGPTTGLYAFGVLLPLALVAVLPAAHVAGIPVGLGTILATYDLLLPAVVLGTSGWLLGRRPVAFAPPRVTRAHPDVPNRRWPVAAACLGVGLGAWLLAPLVLPKWARWVAAVGWAVGTLLVGWYRPVKTVRDHVRAVERHLTDALYQVGQRIRDGEAVETAIARVGSRMDDATGERFAEAARLQRQLRVDVRAAFLGEYGALADVPSPRARSTAALLALAAREGRPAGHAVVSMADHLDELRTLERDGRRELAAVTGTLKSTASTFAPLVAGATVALADGMSGARALDATAPALDTGLLGLSIGWYVLLLAATLTALGVGLERGLDRALVGYRVGVALLSATTIYLLSVVVAGTLV